MKLQLIAVGTRMPDWVDAGFADFARRLPRDCRLELVAVAAADRRNGKGAEHWREDEAQRLLAAAGKDMRLIALDVLGRGLSTEDLAGRLRDWRMDGRDVGLLVGGPDGLAPRCLEAAQMRWSLSPLTLPHALVRVVVAEQIYRAWTLMTGHPYHR
ncbi:MAG: 23S rRNA (pseudouridine(1915)-N(3))-methyltransferase RlmH [Gammaproteobacteria bacterium]|jgi:23S rRNA (pseudouridine1915-N3)-methyltransferase|nr:23S rRNA (pseudouridine(1915)-N(3))-methyltransferase RlmH [Gammaproteobacteria bacterium]